MQTPLIVQLDSHVIDHIAAGEVVERPASVVKELLENAYDAGASLVQVELAQGGLGRITITDDGRGMCPEDAKRCILRHATSKLRKASDLFCIKTLGFRGEALSSIAAISKLTITTRTPDAEAGFRLIIHGGTLVSAEAAGCPVGTCIDVDALFYNTPARRKFMRAPATEQAHVVEAGLRVVLGAQKGGLVVSSGTRRLLDIPESDVSIAGPAMAEAQQERLHCALGHRLGALTPVFYSDENIHVSGFVSEPQLSRSETRGLWLFVNGRFVRDRMLQRAVLESFQAHCPNGYPTAVLWLRLDSAAVDINVHPQKLEVRFADAHLVYRCLGTAVALALRPPGADLGLPLVQDDKSLRGWETPLAPATSVSRSRDVSPRGPAARDAPFVLRPSGGRVGGGAAYRRTAPAPAGHTPTGGLVQALGTLRLGLRRTGSGAHVAAPGPKVPFAAARTAPAWPKRLPEADGVKSVVAPQASQGTLPALGPKAQAPSLALPPSRNFRQVQPLTAVGPGYVLGRLDHDLVLIDAVQAQRRLVADALTKQWSMGGLARQTLMLPPTFAAHKAWAQRLAKAWEDWTAWGLELDCVGPDHYAVRAMPEALRGCCPIAVAQGCLDVVLRLQGMQDEAALRRCVEARWLQLVAWPTAVSGETEAAKTAMRQLLAGLSDACLDIDAVTFAKRLNGAELRPLLHG